MRRFPFLSPKSPLIRCPWTPKESIYFSSPVCNSSTRSLALRWVGAIGKCSSTKGNGLFHMVNCRYFVASKPSMGGYIEDAQIASLGLEIYQDIYGADAIPRIDFVIPHDDDQWPVHLWGYELGVGVNNHIAKFLPNLTPPK